MRSICDVKFVVKAVLWCALAAMGWAQNIPDTPKQDAWHANSEVYTVLRHGGTVYIGGDFSYVGPYTGAGVPVDDAVGGVVSNFPVVNGQVYACAPDGAGGWYIGGSFTEVGGQPRTNVARILADGSVSAWNPAPNASVWCLAMGNGVVYAGGMFSAIGGAARNYIAALDTSSGAAMAWNPNADSTVYAMAVSGAGDVLFVGGSFTNIGGQARNRIASLNTANNNATTWNPNADDFVFNIKLSPDGNKIYASGGFKNIGGLARNYIAAMDATLGMVTAWNPDPDFDVYALAIAPDGNTVYAGGEFSTIGGESRYGIAALDANVNANNATPWDPSANNAVCSLAISPDGATVYAGGDFYRIGGQERSRVAALDAAVNQNNATAWNPGAGGRVYALGMQSNRIYLGGNFSSVGGDVRLYCAALDAATGQLLSNWRADANNRVWKLAISPDGNTLYAGGMFNTMGGATRNYLAALDAATGNLKSWDPSANDHVLALAVAPVSGTVYVGGEFTSIAAQTRWRLAALDPSSGVAAAWAPEVNPFALGSVNAITLSAQDNIVYVGGMFTNISGQARNNIAAIDASTGNPTTWNPNANNFVMTLALAPTGDVLYAGGGFTNIGGQARGRIAAFDTASGNPTAWNPGADGNVYIVKPSITGETVFAGGVFANIGGQARNGLVALNATDGAPCAWNPAPDHGVSGCDVSPDGKTIYVVGEFTNIGGSRHHGFAIFSPQYTLAYIAGANGTISGVTNQVVHHACDGAAVSAIPATGYHFTQWNDQSTANPRQDLSVTGDVAVTANFALTLTPPDAPTGFAASAYGADVGKVCLTWSAAPRATAYEVWRDTSPAGVGMAKVGETAATSYEDTTTAANVNYYYWVCAKNATGSSPFSTRVGGAAGVAGPMLFANALVGDNIRLAAGTPLDLHVRLHKQHYPAVPVDWWVGAYAHNSGAWYYLNSGLQWTGFDGNVLNARPAYQGTLFDLPVRKITTGLTLAPGTYNVWFVVDYPMDGVLHLTPGQYLMSRVTVTVE